MYFRRQNYKKNGIVPEKKRHNDELECGEP